MKRARKHPTLRRTMLLSLPAAIFLFTALAENGHDDGSARTPVSSEFLNTLSEQERAWLRDHPVIRVVQDPGWPPVEFADEYGNPSGMAEDYLGLIEQRLGVKLERVRGLSWQEAYARLKRWEIDMTTSVTVTPERAEFWAFTRSYMTIPIVIATHPEVTYIADMRELAGKTVAVVEGYAVNDWIPRDFPEIRLVRVESAQEGLEKLQRGEVFAYVDCLLIVGHYQAKMKVTNIKIAGETPYVNAQSMAVRKDWALLAGILDKALDSITQTERDDIYRRWLPIRYEHGFDYTVLWRALAVFAAILVPLAVWNRRLAREVVGRKKVEAALSESERKLSEAQRMAQLGHWMWDVRTGNVEWSEEVFRIFGLDPKEFTPQIDSILALSPWPEDHERDEELIRKAMASHEKGDYEQRFLRPDKSIGYYYSTFQGIYDDGGNLVSIVGTVQDITERKRAEEALRLAHERLRRFVDANIVGVVIADTSGSVIEANDYYLRTIGYTREELEQGLVDWRAITPPEWLPADERAIEELRERGICTPYEKQYVWRDGTRVSVFLSDAMLPGPKEQIAAFVLDITERKRAENDYRMLFREMLDGFALHEIVCDGQGNPIDYRFLAVNPAFESMTGLKADDIVGRTVLEVLPGTERHWIDTYGKVALTGEPAFFENCSAELGKHFEVTAFRSQSNQFACIFSDVTERKRAEEERIRLMLAIEQAAEIVIITDSAGAIQYVNPAFERVTGYARDEAIGQNARILKSGAQDASFYRTLWNTISGGGTWEGRIVNKRRNGTQYTEEATISPVRDASGRIVNYVAVKRDITHDLELEQQFRQSQKMEAVGQLAGGVAHDFNNILQAILGYSQMLLDGLPESDEAQGFCTEIIRGAERAAALTRQLLAFSRRQVLDMEDLDLNEVIENVAKMIGRVIGEDIRLSVVPGHRLGTVHADRGQMEQVLMNLCVNARDAMPDGGTLTIETENVVFDDDYCVAHAWAAVGRYVLLSVTDSGCGMDAQTQACIFEPFFTTKDLGKGTGLGLATVYGIVRQHQGMIQVYSELDKGTTFKVYLPIIERAASKIGSKIEARAVGGSETILLAEDDAAVRALTIRLLEGAGYTVLSAANGREAVEVFRENPRQVDMVLADVVMPELGGKGVYDTLTRDYPNLRFLFLSGYSANAVHTGFVLREDVDLIQKPYSLSTLLCKVREVLDRPQKG